MLDWTDRHCRYFLRLFSPRMLLYTEMIVAQAVLRGNRERLLAFDPAEHPVALQLGGSDPEMLAAAAAIGAAAGYDEINLNVGCPSDRVQNASFGACLMARASLVADCVRAMRTAVEVPVSVKCRTGIDDLDSHEFLRDFVATVAGAGCDTFIVHARKAVLAGLSPKQNRDVPPLDHARVTAQFAHVDGVMLGREAYHNPFVLAELHRAIYADEFIPPEPAVVVAAMQDYAGRQIAAGAPLRAITRHLLGLLSGRPGARAWRHALTEGVSRPGATPALLPASLRAALTPTQ